MVSTASKGSVASVCESCGLTESGHHIILTPEEVEDSIGEVVGILTVKLVTKGFKLTEVKCKQQRLGPDDWFYMHGYLVMKFEKQSSTTYGRLDWGSDGLYLQIHDDETQLTKYEAKLRKQLEEQKALRAVATVAAGTTVVGGASAAVGGVAYAAGVGSWGAVLNGAVVGAAGNMAAMGGAAATGAQAILTVNAAVTAAVFATPLVVQFIAVAGIGAAALVGYRVLRSEGYFEQVPDSTRALDSLQRQLIQLANKQKQYSVIEWNCNDFRDHLYREIMKKPVEYDDVYDTEVDENNLNCVAFNAGVALHAALDTDAGATVQPDV